MKRRKSLEEHLLIGKSDEHSIFNIISLMTRLSLDYVLRRVLRVNSSNYYCRWRGSTSLVNESKCLNWVEIELQCAVAN